MSYYWKVIRLKRMDPSTQVEWIRSELVDALRDQDRESKRRRLLHLTDLPSHIPKSDELSKLYDQALAAYHGMPISIRHDPFPVGTPYQGIYSHGVETPARARTLHVSGQVGQQPDGNLPSDFRGQCRQALRNVFSVLSAAGMTPKDIVKMSFYLVRREDMDALVEVRKELLDGFRPAITTLFVAGLVSPDWLVEVDVVACAE
ncbi:MAG TPA: RidA family protein [Thermoanaerobaculia bacterium]|nr:RidA family protein [Thermoanaerobaculia bacterium]